MSALAQFSFLINGSPKGYVKGKRGIRQGCPISPYLFILVMEILNQILKNKVRDGAYKLHYKCKDPQVTHLCFADDLLAFFHGDASSAQGLMEALALFKRCTGLEVNCNKSMVFYAGVDNATKNMIFYTISFSEGSLPVKYWGLPLTSSRLSYENCLPLIEKVVKRVNSWKNRYLSYAGRVVLIKAVLTSMQIYWTTSFILPKSVIDELNAICRKFLWSGTDLSSKVPLVSWKTVCHPYKEGGLAIRNIETSNKAVYFRHIWSLETKPDNLWVQWVNRNLIKERNFWTIPIPADSSWCWRKVLECRSLASNLFLNLIGNGNNVSFWRDPWHPLGVLIERFPLELQYDSTLHLHNNYVSGFRVSRTSCHN